ncbi:Glycosyl transferase, group 2 family protein [Flavobacterium indicum GPTSA100-9 = DSM 17447]|uniref:Glycosyl transferase, group 2 family protein n=1 Tax=Flavobacterium indicum (strain DSM 17447 / CIP 109464 / GPTSA100-9) TaxID=1094466 RepID=H8XT86_FLAIG|nr:glycosyltransferase family 2 protein [Flavobacterium indicum]CCG52683.1 Glycosyl transferase, group 2 family protein [Flavobacterium indicum GPTSA100-9 = DSM 17447]
MNFSLIICTYNRDEAIATLMHSIAKQTVYPEQIIIVDASLNSKTNDFFEKNQFKNIEYYNVDGENRGLTKQRNFGIQKVVATSEIVCFLDDDTILTANYFQELLDTYHKHPEALGVGGYITNEVHWEKLEANKVTDASYYVNDGYIRKEDKRNVLRKRLGLGADKNPGFLPEFSHGRSVSYLPPTDKIYEVEQFMGGVSSFRKKVLDEHKFSTFFDGYGLYEDADFTFRISRIGKLFVNTKAKLEHHHHPSGRPNQYNYGRMVVWNGWYVWRVRHPKPSFKAKVKWHLITLLLAFIRLGNVISTPNKQAAFTEFIGRIAAYIKLFVKKPKIVS